MITDFCSRIFCCVGDGTEIRDSRAIENTKCQNDKERVEALSSAEVSFLAYCYQKNAQSFSCFHSLSLNLRKKQGSVLSFNVFVK